MLVHKCDRCGVIYVENELRIFKHASGLFNPTFVTSKICFANYKDDYREFELCDECLRQIFDFVTHPDRVVCKVAEPEMGYDEKIYEEV